MATQILWKTEEKMRKTIEGFKTELATIRTGRATPTLIEHLKVDYAGVLTPLNQLASISAPEARLLIVQPWDKGSFHSIEKAILTADFGLTPISDKNVIRINVPPLSEERRQELIKVVRRRVEERKVALRNLRREAIEELKGLKDSKQISEDEYKRELSRVQKLTDSFIAEAEQIGRDKEARLIEA